MSIKLTNQDILDYLKVSKARNIYDVLIFYDIKINPEPVEKKVRNQILELQVFEWNIYTKYKKQKL